MIRRELFGGAIVCNIPDGFIDCSQFRQIPDHQEVYHDDSTDVSIIIELLDISEGVTDENLGMHHYRVLASDNSAQFEVRRAETLGSSALPHLPHDSYRQLVCGNQKISKFGESAENTVNVMIMAIRLRPPHNTEILISFNAPATIHANSSSKGRVPIGIDNQFCEQIFTSIIESFKINDYSLFHPNTNQ
eukprot:NODE_7966_length_725_cov_25.621262_g7350_i0.p1 GENE.NODE_7966_length_725_cov_25.621262_g7350_i0~~NODE_7966_length_725_cov_25.621262_g7350_i0.p1  ORF type:complete len:211 (+),score=33.10 NODE_7966_length_725_cov_25.621262_g7350_i0:66-635(+)